MIENPGNAPPDDATARLQRRLRPIVWPSRALTRRSAADGPPPWWLRPRMLIALWALAALAVFAFALIATFPYNLSVSRLLAPYQLKLVYQAQHPRLPIGVELENVKLVSLAGRAAAPLL